MKKVKAAKKTKIPQHRNLNPDLHLGIHRKLMGTGNVKPQLRVWILRKMLRDVSSLLLESEKVVKLIWGRSES